MQLEQARAGLVRALGRQALAQLEVGLELGAPEGGGLREGRGGFRVISEGWRNLGSRSCCSLSTLSPNLAYWTLAGSMLSGLQGMQSSLHSIYPTKIDQRHSHQHRRKP